MTERITEENRSYIKALRVSDVPWHRLTTVYGRATAFPEYFAVLEEMRDAAGVRKAFEELGYNVEHQDTLWHATPFASVFLARIFEKALSESAENPVAAYLAEQLTELFDFLLLALILLIIILVHLGSLSPQHKSPRRPVWEAAGTLSVRAYMLSVKRCETLSQPLLIAACAAASLATGTRNGEQET